MDETRQQPATGDPDDRRPLKLSFSLAQIIGSALAAATAAYLGSTLGTAGTIIGAALASVVGAVASTIYTAGLDRTGRSLTSVMHRGWDRVRGADPSVEVAAEGDFGLVVEPVADAGDGEPGARGRAWRAVALRVGLAAVAIFVVAFAAITIFELATGRSLDGSEGTTVSQVARPQRDPAPAPSESPSANPSPEPSETPSETPSATEPGPEPTPTETATQPTGEPTADTSVSPGPAAESPLPTGG